MLYVMTISFLCLIKFLYLNAAMVLKARINSHNERPEGAETALWISSVPRDAVGLV